jgi:ATP-dependent DNA helicase RecG
LGKPTAYIRQHGFEPLQHEQMILQYLDKYGKITRAQAAELCLLSVNQAYRLLKSLEKRGILVAHGDKKGRYYERHT